MANDKGNRFSAQPHRPAGPRLLDLILKAGAFFVIFEPIWMLLPFAGFLYGSVMHIEALSKNPFTAKLVYFVFPTHTLFPLGLILILVGSMIFLLGAFQVYSGKLKNKGLITTGIYRKFRHPQYLALIIFGIGIILTWGRFISFISFFIMLWLYYFLAESEEEQCRNLFGQEYEEYRRHTFFLFPGEKILAELFRRLPLPKISGPKMVLVSFILVTGFAAATGLLIIKARSALRATLPVIAGAYPTTALTNNSLPLLLVKGPALQAAPSEEVRDKFMADSFEMLLSSPGIADVVAKLGQDSSTTLLAFLTPGNNWFDAPNHDFRKAQVNFMIFAIGSPIRYNGANFREFRKSWQIAGLITAKEVSYHRLFFGLDPVAGEITTEPYDPRMEERIDFLLSGL